MIDEQVTLRDGKVGYHARHTAEIVPGAKLRVVPELGHFSILGKVIDELPALPR